MDIAWLIWVWLDLLAQVPNEDPQTSSITRMVRTPKKLEQFQVRHWLALVVFDVSQTDGQELPEIGNVNGDPREYRERLG